ncbi:MAG: hypothetical protein SFV52_02945 [Saprospiraceae bacterium]|nr:hypothetical protein [Saprospiraceae bacterium]
MLHRNSDDSEELHHLYEIVDKVDYDVFKYGISSDPISTKDGMSKRMRVQLRFANLIDNWARFFTRILIRDIPGRKEAKRLENEHIQAYKEKHGRRPRGNLTD